MAASRYASVNAHLQDHEQLLQQ